MRFPNTSPAVAILALCILSVISGCAMRSSGATDLIRAEQLATEQGRVYDLSDPVAKTKSYVKISEILLDFAADAAKARDARLLTTRLNQYTAAIRNARDTMTRSGRNAEQLPQGFDDLEGAINGQLRHLENMSRGLPADQSQVVEAAIEAATMVREDMLRLLGSQAAKPRT